MLKYSNKRIVPKNEYIFQSKKYRNMLRYSKLIEEKMKTKTKKHKTIEVITVSAGEF